MEAPYRFRRDERVPAEIEPLAETHFAGLREALDRVAREKKYLAFEQAPSEDDAYAFYRNVLATGGALFVALVDGRVVGWCDALRTHGESRAHVAILGIGLMAKARGQGLGSRLMDAAIEKARAQGMTRIELTVRADNLRAKALYEKKGFAVEGLHRGAFRVDGSTIDSFSMALALAPHDDHDPRHPPPGS